MVRKILLEPRGRNSICYLRSLLLCVICRMPQPRLSMSALPNREGHNWRDGPAAGSISRARSQGRVCGCRSLTQNTQETL